MRIFYFIILISFVTSLNSISQVITSNPTLPIETDNVEISFYADQGNQGLKDYTGDIYAHTGVITDKSDGEWKYAPSWGDNDVKYKMNRVSANVYTLSISPDVKEYYGVADGEKVLRMAFVFRSADNSKEGKDVGNKDIFINVSEEALSVAISKPLNGSLYEQGQDVEIRADALLNDKLELFINEVSVASTTDQTLSYTVEGVSAGDYIIKAVASKGVSESIDTIAKFFVREDVINETIPDGLKRGVNNIDNQSVTMVLFAPSKEFVHVIGEFNNWEPSNDYLMKKDGDNFWLTINSLNKDVEYAFQFLIDGEIRIADPYTTKTLDPDDKWIPESVYPNLKVYPSDKTEHVASVFKINEVQYEWVIENFENPDVSELVIYELHVRDFTDNGDIKTVTDSINYLKTLGVNAIELMPFNEFEGNDSWGYNPSFYFASDKAYGTANDYKEFVDVCHQNGMAVIMDIVLNHSFGQSPFARMYLEDGKPASNNPWYNREHNMLEPAAQWGYDFNHESVETQALVDSINAYWLKEYKIDGFRFDFTKGFTNTSYPVGDWASAYNKDRIDILTRMSNYIWQVKSDAIISFEHLADNSEEKELANHGILMWGNSNHDFTEAVMGYSSNFSWTSYKERGWDNPHVISYMESHDEERVMYKTKEYGNSDGSYDTKVLKTGLNRKEAAAVFLMTIPGPKMIWQFGELGYDYSINYCIDSDNDDCRTGKKPVRWDYMEDDNRMDLYETYSRIIDLKKEEPVFATADFDMQVSSYTKRIELNYPDSDVRLVGNFDVVEKSIAPNFSSTGYWYNHFKGDSINVSDLNQTFALNPGEFALLTQKKLKGFVPHTSIGDPTYFDNARVAPNPVKDILKVYSGDNPFTKLKVTSITGVTLLDKEIRNSEDVIDVSEYSAGMYLIHLIGDDNGYKVLKFIKQ
ncbi:alpha-amylase family glycosyl hydrolase [Labilibacter marinus]|uniref:alpha-amylase family glycosyl hydrolase n=1 Tax=Labilibacter marinus TaxID=1477105 RepID=UPI00082C9567|nr:alpha-amylase family glycosyl hydrolase [Labilibacter marinus]